MPEIERLTMTLPAQMVTEIRQVVEGGDYESASDIVGEALRDWTNATSQSKSQAWAVTYVLS